MRLQRRWRRRKWGQDPVGFWDGESDGAISRRAGRQFGLGGGMEGVDVTLPLGNGHNWPTKGKGHAELCFSGRCHRSFFRLLDSCLFGVGYRGAGRNGRSGAARRFLRRSIAELLGGSEDAVKTFYGHPAIDSLFWGKYADARSCDPRRRLPSYIPPRNFAIALIGGVLDASRSGGNAGAANGGGGATATVGTTGELRDAVGRSGDAAGRMLRAVVNVAGDDMEKVLAGVERLFEAAQERVTGRFKRYTTGILFVIGVFLAYCINVDTIELVKYLAGDAAVRNALIEGAGRYVGAVESEDLVALARELQGLSVAPLGRSVGSGSGGLLGLVLTACAISLGGPFWLRSAWEAGTGAWRAETQRWRGRQGRNGGVSAGAVWECGSACLVCNVRAARPVVWGRLSSEKWRGVLRVGVEER